MNSQLDMAVIIKDLYFEYNLGTPVLKIPTLEIYSGAKVFIYGPSGFGKSTLLNLLSGVLTAKVGTIEVLGKNLNAMGSSDRDRLRGEELGYIFQIFNLIPYLSALENILLPCMINKKRSHGQDIYKQAEELLIKLNLIDFKDKKASTLSIGQQQRVAQARALIGHPKIIIADEPTSSLDEKNTQEFMNLLLGEWEKRKFTLIFVSHDERLKSYFDYTLSLVELNRNLL